MRTYKKPLGRSIATGCIAFTAILCLVLCLLNFVNERRSLYQRYQTYITDILKYVESHIDHEDLKNCVETLEESEKYKETLLFMDQIMNDFSIHYLYAVKPLNLNETNNVLSVLSAEDDYNRYVDNEGNLYLGWISDDEYDVQTVKQLFNIMKNDGITFFTEKTGWSTDYTGAMPLRTEDGEAYAVLAVDVDITTLSHELWSQVLRNAAIILILGLVYTITFLFWTRENITAPVRTLEEGVVDYAGRSHGQRDVEALRFQAPLIRPDNEVKSLSKAITKMTEDMQDYVSEIISAEKKTKDMKELADAMSELATMDTLTGIQNKTAYSREANVLEQEIADNHMPAFGVAMIDLNFLKLINDNYGHEKGDEALKRLSETTCDVFSHSPVYRVGGDEFVVILRGRDFQEREELKAKFISKVADRLHEEPWKNISASIGIAVYEPETDKCVDDVLKRADKAMYAMKKSMKASRETAYGQQ